MAENTPNFIVANNSDSDKDDSDSSNQSGLLKLKVAVVDDDNGVRRAIALHLKSEGFDVYEATNGEEGLELIQKECPDVIILDVMMPEKDGLQTCKELRSSGISTPLILLTARSSEVDKVLGLDLGADDYLAKPFSIIELVARVKALARRGKTTRQVDKVHFANVVVDFKAYKAERDAQPLDLSAREYRLLRYLIAKAGSVVSRDELLDEVWGYNSYPTTRTVDNHISKLRQKIECDIAEPRHILTVHGVGYKFVA